MADGALTENALVTRFERLVANDVDGALLFFFDIYPDLSFNRRLHCCLYLKEAGHLEPAWRAMQRLLDEAPPEAWACYEAAVLRDMMCDSDGALALFDQALERQPELPAAFMRKAIILTGRHDHAAVEAMLNSPAAQIVPPPQRAFLSAFNDPDDPWREHFEKLDAPSKPVLSAADSVRAAADALSAGQPFSLVRLGDGEGAFLLPDDDDGTGLLSAQARSYFAERWYGRNDDATLNTITAIMDHLPEIVASADIVGRPNPEWCRHEWDHGNLRTLACCLSASLYAETLATTLTSTSVSLDMTYAGALPQLVRQARSVCLVTCHAGLGARMARISGEDKFTTVLIPPAHSDLGITGLDTDGNHLDRAQDILCAIDAAQGHQLFLVGAGVLGKLYTHRARMGGAVAIDVGSVLDGILNFETRPNFRDIDLPQRFWGRLAQPAEASL